MEAISRPVLRAIDVLGQETLLHLHHLEFLEYVAVYSKKSIDFEGLSVNLGSLSQGIKDRADALIRLGYFKVRSGFSFGGNPRFKYDPVDDHDLVGRSLQASTSGYWYWSEQSLTSLGMDVATLFANRLQLPSNLLKIPAYWWVFGRSATDSVRIDMSTNSQADMLNPLLTLVNTTASLATPIEVITRGIDTDWSLHCYMSQVLTPGPLTLEEKVKTLETDFRTESLYYLVTRDGLTKTNPQGIVKDSHLVRYEGVKVKHSSLYLAVTVLHGATYTVADNQMTHSLLSEKAQVAFGDLARPDRKSISKSWEEILLSDVGLDFRFGKEPYLLTHLTEVSLNSAMIHDAQGNIIPAELDDIDLAYWIACENGVDFDRRAYREEYSPVKELRYDQLHPYDGVDV